MENKELSGVMFPNTKTSEKAPDLRGSVKIGGVDYEVAGWKRKSKNGLAYISLALQKKGERPQKKAGHTPKETVSQVSEAVGGMTELQSTSIYEEVPF